MEFKLFKLDIDELIKEFAESESPSFAEFKKVWLSKKFSFIFEASPSSGQGCFMQTLYAHSIGYIGSTGSLWSRLGGLYCLYCLYETQPFKPPFKIYLSIEELRRLKTLLRDANTIRAGVVSALLKSMLERNVFLFGSTGVTKGSAAERVNELSDRENAHMQALYNKLFEDKDKATRLEHFIHMDMGGELEVDLLHKRSSEYEAAKELAIKEAGKEVDVQNIKHIAENKRRIGEEVGKAAAAWNSQKELFYQQRGYEQQEDNDDLVRELEMSGYEQQEDNDDFARELEDVLGSELEDNDDLG